MIKNYLIYALYVFIFTVFVSCTKEVPPELLNKPKTNEPGDITKRDMPDDSIHRNLKNKTDQQGSSMEKAGDENTEKIVKEADEADAAYRKSNSEKDKKTCIEMQMKAANFLMFEADLPPREKYKPALQRYRRVLELDPSNKEALANKKQIEDIYESMGKPIPN
ncbi:MAG: hypothetical protein JSS91_01595 [Bacteroidetes bacterium]|nr:hypothetical protein [Bacteroidota bacterium]